MDELDDRKQEETEEPAGGQGAIRSAYLARQSQDAGTGGGGETVTSTLRGVYVSQVGRETRRRDDAVKGSEQTGAAVLRSIYAARSETIVETPRRAARATPQRKAKAKKAGPARKARPVRKARAAVKARTPARAKGRGRAAAKRRPARKASRRR
jgi:hypothetical protein